MTNPYAYNEPKQPETKKWSNFAIYWSGVIVLFPINYWLLSLIPESELRREVKTFYLAISVFAWPFTIFVEIGTLILVGIALGIQWYSTVLFP